MVNIGKFFFLVFCVGHFPSHCLIYTQAPNCKGIEQASQPPSPRCSNQNEPALRLPTPQRILPLLDFSTQNKPALCLPTF